MDKAERSWQGGVQLRSGCGDGGVELGDHSAEVGDGALGLQAGKTSGNQLQGFTEGSADFNVQGLDSGRTRADRDSFQGVVRIVELGDVVLDLNTDGTVSCSIVGLHGVNVEHDLATACREGIDYRGNASIGICRLPGNEGVRQSESGSAEGQDSAEEHFGSAISKPWTRHREADERELEAFISTPPTVPITTR